MQQNAGAMSQHSPVLLFGVLFPRLTFQERGVQGLFAMIQFLILFKILIFTYLPAPALVAAHRIFSVC